MRREEQPIAIVRHWETADDFACRADRTMISLPYLYRLRHEDTQFLHSRGATLRHDGSL
jgi:hypothetical protein